MLKAARLRESLVLEYDGSHEGSLCYPISAFVSAADDACRMLVEPKFSLHYRQFLWSLYLASCPISRPSLSERKFFAIINEGEAETATELGS